MELNDLNPKVSVIVPIYNAQQYLVYTLDSILKQTYLNWECICIDDASSDDSSKIIDSYAKKDSRFKIITLSQNCGAAHARNEGIKKADGDYLAFIDSDDVWESHKLEKQLEFMIQNDYDFTCTSYGKIDVNNKVLDKECRVKSIYIYDDVLTNCPGNSTIIYNCKKYGKIYGPVILKRNDLAMWLKVIRKIGSIYGLDEILGYHRLRPDSLSYNKIQLVYYQYKVYRSCEELSVFKSISLVFIKILQTIARKNG